MFTVPSEPCKPRWHFMLDSATTAILPRTTSYGIGPVTIHPLSSDGTISSSWATSIPSCSTVREPNGPSVRDIRLGERRSSGKSLANQHRNTLVRMSPRSGECSTCQFARRTSGIRAARKPLAALAAGSIRRNTIGGSAVTRSAQMPKRSVYRCDVCEIWLCKGGRCWDEHLEAVAQRIRPGM